MKSSSAAAPMRVHRNTRILAAAALATIPAISARAEDVSASAILQLFEAKWQTIERRAPDIFMAGYGGLWTPPPGRAEQGNLSVGYDVYDRFDLGSAGNPTMYGTETGLKTTVAEMHKIGTSVYTDLVWNHNGFADQGTAGFQQAGGYPGFVLSRPDAVDGDFHGKFESGDYAGRISNLIDINHATNFQYIRNPVPGYANNLPAGTPSAYGRTANVATDANRRFYPHLQGPSTTINGVTYYHWNAANPLAGDPVAENATGYLMRHTRWMIEEIGVDGFRLDATKHLHDSGSGNPDWVLEFYDVAANPGTRTPLLDGSKKRVFAFGEFLDSNVGLVQQTIKKDANANRDALDFAMHYALKNNLTGNGLGNDWRNIVNTTQDTGDDGLANNGSQGVAFDASHDDGGAVLGNVANAYLMMRPGNAIIYMNAKEMGAGRDFPKDGRGDALGGYHGNTVTRLVDIRNSHGRGNYQERWIDKETLVFERQKSAVAAYSNRTDAGYDERTVNTSFLPGTHLVELTGNATDAAVDPANDLFDTVVVQPTGQITIRIPRNTASGAGAAQHNKGYVIYGPQTPKGSVSVSNVARTIAGETATAANNGTVRLSAIDVIKANTFNFTLNTNAVTLSDGFRDVNADGDNAILKVDGGLNVNGNAGVDFTAAGVAYGFENFLTQKAPGYGSATGNGTYVQTIDATQLSEGYHYLTARAFRRGVDNAPAIYSDFRKAVYVDRLRPQSAIAELKPYGPDDIDVLVRSTDKTATGVHVFQNLGAALTDDQVLQMALSGQGNTDLLDRDIFKRGFNDWKDGNHAITVVTFEMSYNDPLKYAGGGVNVQRFVGIPFSGGAGLGLGDLNFDNAYTAADASLFQSFLQTNNGNFNPAGDYNADGWMNEADNVLNVPWLTHLGADAATVTQATNTRLTRAIQLDGTMHVPAGTLDVSGASIPATPLTFTTAFNIPANRTITKTGGQTLNINAPQSHNANATLAVAGGAANLNTDGGTNLAVNTSGVATVTNFGATQHLRSVGVAGGALVTVIPGGSKVLVTRALNLTGGKLDLNDNNAVVDYPVGPSPLTALVDQLLSGRNDGTWNGASGILSSAAATTSGVTTLAMDEASTVLGLAGSQTALFMGQTVDASSVLVKYTYDGDANLDGVINGDDYASIDFNVNDPAASGYARGDFNYDGVINGDDYAAIDFNVGAQGAPFPSAPPASALPLQAVPEPAGLALAGVAVSVLMSRRRRIAAAAAPRTMRSPEL